jgi:chromosome segregation ATPase
MSNYNEKAREKAREAVNSFRDEIVEQFLNGEASDDLLNDYPGGDEYHYESHVDRDYNLIEAAMVLHQLCKYEETDKGLWQDLDPRKAICAQAAYTFANAVYNEWRRLIARINEESEVVLEKYNNSFDEINGAILDIDSDTEELEDKIDELKGKIAAGDKAAECEFDRLSVQLDVLRELLQLTQQRLEKIETNKTAALKKLIDHIIS